MLLVDVPADKVSNGRISTMTNHVHTLQDKHRDLPDVGHVAVIFWNAGAITANVIR